MEPSETHARFAHLITQLLDSHPSTLSPHVWGPLVASGKRSVADVVRVMAATSDRYARTTLLTSVATSVDAATARALLDASAPDWPSTAVAWLAHAAGDRTRLAAELARAVAQRQLSGEAVTLLAQLPRDPRDRLVAEFVASLGDELLDRLDDTRAVAEIVGPEGASLVAPLLGRLETELTENEDSLSWDSGYDEVDPRLAMAELYGALGRRADAERFVARAEALPYPFNPETPPGPTPESRATRAILDGGPRPEPRRAVVDADAAARMLADLRGWAETLTWAARLLPRGAVRTAALDLAMRVAGTDLFQRAAVLETGHGDAAAYSGFAEDLLARSDANDVSYFARVAAAAPPAIGKRMARHLLRRTFADDFGPLDRGHYRRLALRTVVETLGDETAATWRELELPVATTELSLLPREIAERELARRLAAAGDDVVALARLGDAAVEAALPGAAELHRRAVAAVTRAKRRREKIALDDAYYLLSLDADAAELTQLVDALESVDASSQGYAALFDRAMTLGDAALIARTGAHRFAVEPGPAPRPDEQGDDENPYVVAARRVWAAASVADVQDVLAWPNAAASMVEDAIAARGFALDYLRVRFAGPVSPGIFFSLDRQLEKLHLDRAVVEPLLAAAFERSPPPIELTGNARLLHLVEAYAVMGQGDAAVGGIVSAIAARADAAPPRPSATQ